MVLFVYYHFTNVPSTELSLGFLWIPVGTDVMLLLSPLLVPRWFQRDSAICR